MRGAVVGSGLVHVVLLAILAFGRVPTSVVVPGPEVVQVSLIDPSATLAPVVPKAPEPQPQKPEPIKPTNEPGVKLEHTPPKKAPPPKEEEPPPPTTAPVPTIPSAAVGNSGLRGDVSLDATNFEFTYYLLLVRNKIALNWTPPAGVSGGGQRVRAVVYFRIGRGGDVSSVRIETGSTLEFFDHSALRAVTLSDPFPPLPLGYNGADLGIHFGFDWVAP